MALVPLLWIKGRALALYHVFFLLSFAHDHRFCLYPMSTIFYLMNGGNDLSHILPVVILDLCMLLCIIVINVQSFLETLPLE